jgi:predicted amidophosphoribosyltransferase
MGVTMRKFNPFSDFFNLLYPDLCVVCGENLLRNEQHICLSCLSSIPKTNYHNQPDNPIEKRFWGKVPVHRATAFFFFQKGSSFQKLLHALKYKGNKEIGEQIGKYAAVDLLESDGSFGAALGSGFGFGYYNSAKEAVSKIKRISLCTCLV